MRTGPNVNTLLLNGQQMGTERVSLTVSSDDSVCTICDHEFSLGNFVTAPHRATESISNSRHIVFRSEINCTLRAHLFYEHIITRPASTGLM